jgi:hypothetical protein
VPDTRKTFPIVDPVKVKAPLSVPLSVAARVRELLLPSLKAALTLSDPKLVQPPDTGVKQVVRVPAYVPDSFGVSVAVNVPASWPPASSTPDEVHVPEIVLPSNTPCPWKLHGVASQLSNVALKERDDPSAVPVIEVAQPS